MKDILLSDWSETKQIRVVHEKKFFILPDENIAIRPCDYINKENELFYERNFPIFTALSNRSMSLYRQRGIYQPERIDILDAISNGRLENIVWDKFKEDKFFYTTKMMPIDRAFPMTINSKEWDVFNAEKDLKKIPNVSHVEVIPSKEEGLFDLNFIYHTKSSVEFDKIYKICFDSGFATYPLQAHIFCITDIVRYYYGD